MTHPGITITDLRPDAAAPFAALTYPLFRDLVTAPPDRDMIYFGASDEDGNPVGLAFGMGVTCPH